MLLDKSADQVSASHLQKLIDSIPGIICTLNAEGSFVFANKEVQVLLGFTPEDLNEKPFTNIFSQRDFEKITRSFDLLTSGFNTLSLHAECIKKDGEASSLFWIMRWDSEKKLFYCLGHSGTEKAKSDPLHLQFEKKVKEHNRNLFDILERIEEGFIAVDEEDRVIYWNRQAEKISGKFREEVLTRNIFDCYPEIIKSALYQSYQKAKLLQTPQRYEAYYPENQKWIEVAIYPSKKGLTGFFKDITEKKLLEENIEWQKRENQKRITSAVINAQEKERAQVGLELHDNVNQVLTTVKLYTELSMNDIGGKELMNKSMNLLQSCIDEIRSLSKQLSAPTLGNIRMKDSITELVDSIAATGKASVSLDTNNIQDLEVTTEMHLAIYRILQEHLTNILKHANANEVLIVVNYLDDDLIVKVSDNGKGFKMNDKKTGIGISNMISRVESLGGRLTINSAPGLGCVLIAQFTLQKKLAVLS